MAKPIKLIATVSGKDAEKFVKELKGSSPNPKREKTIRMARALKVTFV